MPSDNTGGRGTPKYTQTRKARECSKDFKVGCRSLGRESYGLNLRELGDDTGRPDQFELFNPPKADKKQAYADLYGTIIKLRPGARISTATDTISEETDPAHTHMLASIRKDPRETFYAVATDWDGKKVRRFLLSHP
ncbi:MAG: hypothetical protein CMK46_04170 [Porticoccus sp.]|nr:hypothetical protein [Porticoccus sp.]|tara:strand:+ start:10272 stop:10682 length:411 start_codon:yes stop_codon:yes gene_type:complete